MLSDRSFTRASLREAAIALAIVAVTAGSVTYAVRGSGEALQIVRLNCLPIVAWSFLLYLALRLPAGSWVARVATGVWLVLLAGGFLLEIVSLNFFAVPFHTIFPYLPVTARELSPAIFMAWGRAYLSAGLVLAALAPLGAGILLSFSGRRRARGSVLAAGSAVAAIALAGLVLDTGAPRASVSSLFDEPPIPARPLHAADRSGALHLLPRPVATPRTIVLIILESAGRLVPASDGRVLLADKLIEIGGSEGWIAFDNAVTGSNASDIAIPTILTGSGPEEGIEKLHRMPLLFELASSRGYRTALFSSSSLRWAHFDRYLKGAGIEELFDADDAGRPLVNELGIDDYYTFEAAARLVREAPEKLFLTLYPNGLHVPFQQESRFAIPADLQSPRARAAYIEEKGFQMLIGALRDAERLDDAMIIVIGDHGEAETDRPPAVATARLQSFSSGVLAPVFLMKLPRDFPAHLAKAAKGNGERLVTGVDIAPTLAHMLGTSLNEGLAYHGANLFEPIPAERIAISLATNEWRSWPRSALAISRGRERLLCDTSAWCATYRDAGGGLDKLGPVAVDDPLMAVTMADGTLRRVLGAIYRQHTAGRYLKR